MTEALELWDRFPHTDRGALLTLLSTCAGIKGHLGIHELDLGPYLQLLANRRAIPELFQTTHPVRSMQVMHQALRGLANTSMVTMDSGGLYRITDKGMGKVEKMLGQKDEDLDGWQQDLTRMMRNLLRRSPQNISKELIRYDKKTR